MTELFQLVARGNLLKWEGSGKVHSRSVFESQDDAYRFVPEFREIVTRPDGIMDALTLADDPRLLIKVVTLELIPRKGDNQCEPES